MRLAIWEIDPSLSDLPSVVGTKAFRASLFNWRQCVSVRANPPGPQIDQNPVQYISSITICSLVDIAWICGVSETSAKRSCECVCLCLPRNIGLLVVQEMVHQVWRNGAAQSLTISGQVNQNGSFNYRVLGHRELLKAEEPPHNLPSWGREREEFCLSIEARRINAV